LISALVDSTVRACNVPGESRLWSVQSVDWRGQVFGSQIEWSIRLGRDLFNRREDEEEAHQLERKPDEKHSSPSGACPRHLDVVHLSYEMEITNKQVVSS